MAVRNVVKIDEEKCNGCGICVKACAEGAIQMINGKAKLVSDIYCDGLGACIGHCPQDAITIEKRDADDFSEEAVKKHMASHGAEHGHSHDHSHSHDGFVCPGMAAKQFTKKQASPASRQIKMESQLTQWPIQLKLVSPMASYFKNSDLLLVADCVPFSIADFHNRFLKDHSIAVGCPKLDDSQFYIEKFAQILKSNNINSLTVIHMEVPCCSGLTFIAKEAIKAAGLNMSFDDITISLQGEIIKTQKI
jgi:Pyruvate/2-oxoacid:ferredoxin oxidoreductase delta subunit